MSVTPRFARLTALALATALLAGCAAAGPNWHGAPLAAPDAAARGQFLRAPDAAGTEAPVDHWWSVLGDPVLDDLEARALAGSPDLAAAQARIGSARAALAVTKGATLPSAPLSKSLPWRWYKVRLNSVYKNAKLGWY